MAEDFPYRFEVTTSPAELQDRFANLGPSEGSGHIATVAGRIMLRREMGKLTFLTLTDWTGSLQLFAGAAMDSPVRRAQQAFPGGLGWGYRGGRPHKDGRALASIERVGPACRSTTLFW